MLQLVHHVLGNDELPFDEAGFCHGKDPAVDDGAGVHILAAGVAVLSDLALFPGAGQAGDHGHELPAAALADVVAQGAEGQVQDGCQRRAGDAVAEEGEHLAQQRRDDQAQDQADDGGQQLVDRHFVKFLLHIPGEVAHVLDDAAAQQQQDQAAQHTHAGIGRHGHPGGDVRGLVAQAVQGQAQLRRGQADADAEKDE